MGLNSLSKAERLSSHTIIRQLFDGNTAKRVVCYPLKVMYMPVQDMDAHVAVLISVSKRRIKHAVRRNLVKRRVREAYRKNKQPLTELIKQKKLRLTIAFVYMTNEPLPSVAMDKTMKCALSRIMENL